MQQRRITDEMKTMNVIVVIAVAVVLLHGAEATLYTVGDDLGWAIPPGGAATYAAWAAKHSFVVDDELGEIILPSNLVLWSIFHYTVFSVYFVLIKQNTITMQTKW